MGSAGLSAGRWHAHLDSDTRGTETGTEPAVASLPALTVLAHPDPARWGERALLLALLEGRAVGLSRRQPLFLGPELPDPDVTRGDGADGMPLADPRLSRRPLVLTPAGPEGIRLDPRGDRLRVELDGEPLDRARTVPWCRLESGVSLLLAGRVALLLHAIPAELASPAGLAVAHYCRLLEEAHIVRLVRPFVGGKRAEITSSPKVYFLDNGLRNQIFGGFAGLDERADRGALMENLVFSELSKVLNPLLDGLRYWRSKAGAEVDFVVEHQGRLLAVEVKAGDAHGKVGRGHRSFIEAYQPEQLLVVNDASHPTRDVASTRVEFLGIEALATVVRNWLAGRAPTPPPQTPSIAIQ